MRTRNVVTCRSAGLLAAALAIPVICACGSGGGGGVAVLAGRPHKSNRVVDASKPPYIRGFAINPRDASILLATNTGLYRVTAAGRTLERLRGRALAGGASGSYGRKASAIAAIGPDRLIGSGHPDSAGKLPGFLGFMKSGDGGRTWKAIARVGLSDLHVITVAHRRIYAFDTVLGAVIVSDDGGERLPSALRLPGPCSTWRSTRAILTTCSRAPRTPSFARTTRDGAGARWGAHGRRALRGRRGVSFGPTSMA